MEKKLSWAEISKRFDKQWVELIDYDWPDEDVYPLSGVVRVHALDRADFHRLIAQEPAPDSAIVFVGKVELPKGVIFSPGFRQLVPNSA